MYPSTGPSNPQHPGPGTPPSTGGRSTTKTVIGWILIVVGGLAGLGNLVSGNGFGGRIGGLLVGAAIVIVGAMLIRPFTSWKVAAPGAGVALVLGALIIPSTTKDPTPTSGLVGPTPVTTVTTSATETVTVTATTTTTRAPSSTTTTTTTAAPTTTTTTFAMPPNPGVTETDTRTPIPVPRTPATTDGNSGGSGSTGGSGSGGRTGAICKDGSHDSRTGRGACSHHGGVATWTY